MMKERRRRERDFCGFKQLNATEDELRLTDYVVYLRMLSVSF